jgi:hypothetical protein
MSIVRDPNHYPSSREERHMDAQVSLLSGARETWVIEYYKHIAPLELRSEDADSNELLFAFVLTTLMAGTIASAIDRIPYRL